MFEIIQSETFQGWLSGLKDRQAVAKIHARLDRAAGGNLGDVKPVREGISELRISYDDLSADPTAEVARICAALGVTPPLAGSLRPRVARLADASSADWMRRYRADLAAL